MTRWTKPIPTAEAVLEEAITALHDAGHIVQKLAIPPSTYSVENGPPLSAAQVIALAWDAGLIGKPEGMQ
jgi:hypothetical protein